MITPLDIQNKEFPRGVRGYKEEDVDAFLDLVMLDFEKMLEENEKLKEQVKVLTIEVGRYKTTESTVLETLEAAKALMGDISASAERRAEILLKNAELDANIIQREAREGVERLTEESTVLRNRYISFRMKFKNLLETELEQFDTLSASLFEDKDMAELRSITEGDSAPVVADAEKTRGTIRVGEEDI